MQSDRKPMTVVSPSLRTMASMRAPYSSSSVVPRRAQVGKLRRTAPQNLWQTGAPRHPARRGQQQGRAQHRPFEFRRGHAGKVYPRAQLFFGSLVAYFASFPEKFSIVFYYSIIHSVNQT